VEPLHLDTEQGSKLSTPHTVLTAMRHDSAGALARVAVMCCCCGVGGAPHGTVSDWDCQQLRSGSWGSAVECSGALSTRRPVGSSDDARSTLRAEGFRGGAVGV
jgi:hypothetical protein